MEGEEKVVVAVVAVVAVGIVAYLVGTAYKSFTVWWQEWIFQLQIFKADQPDNVYPGTSRNPWQLEKPSQ